MLPIIAPSILAADAANLEREVKLVEESGAKYLHIDIMDGHFVPNLSYSTLTVKALREKSDMVFDVHLMVEHPENFVDAFADAGADVIIFHDETREFGTNVVALINRIRGLGLKAGISLKPATPISRLEGYLHMLDSVLLMTVEPGRGGQQYLEFVNEKISRLRKMIDDRNLAIDIEVDGGVGPNNVHIPVEAGANIIVAGSAIFGSEDYRGTIELMSKNAAAAAGCLNAIV